MGIYWYAYIDMHNFSNVCLVEMDYSDYKWNMPEKPNLEKEQPEKTENFPFEKPESEDDDWGSDQKKKSYYYDDSHGYEIYNPDEDDDAEDEQENSAKK